jgi:hypothetical protein
MVTPTQSGENAGAARGGFRAGSEEVSLQGRTHMKSSTLAVAAVLCAFAMSVHAADSSCESTAAEKHLAGAAKTSFMKKCERTANESAAKTQCDSKAADKKLHGAAKTSFVNKCVKDASG